MTEMEALIQDTNEIIDHIKSNLDKLDLEGQQSLNKNLRELVLQRDDMMNGKAVLPSVTGSDPRD